MQLRISRYFLYWSLMLISNVAIHGNRHIYVADIENGWREKSMLENAMRKRIGTFNPHYVPVVLQYYQHVQYV